MDLFLLSDEDSSFEESFEYVGLLKESLDAAGSTSSSKSSIHAYGISYTLTITTAYVKQSLSFTNEAHFVLVLKQEADRTNVPFNMTNGNIPVFVETR